MDPDTSVRVASQPALRRDATVGDRGGVSAFIANFWVGARSAIHTVDLKIVSDPSPLRIPPIM